MVDCRGFDDGRRRRLGLLCWLVNCHIFGLTFEVDWRVKNVISYVQSDHAQAKHIN